MTGIPEFKPLEGADPQRLGQFEVIGRIGAGGMGVVFLGRSPGGRFAAIKVVRPELAGDEEFRTRFHREIDAARKVSGAFTAPVLDADPDAERPWLATAYVAGKTLLARVKEDGPLPTEEVRTLGAGLAEALAELHRVGLVHRDVKPSNVMLAADGARLIDFGIIRADSLAELTETGTVLGSAGFMAPEQAEGRPTGPAADVFSFGAVLVFAALGRGPFGTGSAATLLLRTVNEEPDTVGVPEGLRSVVARCLSRDPSERPSDLQLLEWLAPRADPPPYRPPMRRTAVPHPVTAPDLLDRLDQPFPPWQTPVPDLDPYSDPNRPALRRIRPATLTHRRPVVAQSHQPLEPAKPARRGVLGTIVIGAIGFGIAKSCTGSTPDSSGGGPSGGPYPMPTMRPPNAGTSAGDDFPSQATP